MHAKHLAPASGDDTSEDGVPHSRRGRYAAFDPSPAHLDIENIKVAPSPRVDCDQYALGPHKHIKKHRYIFENLYLNKKGQPTRRETPGEFLRDVAIIVVVAVAISALVRAFLFRSFYIPSGSMEPTLLVDDRVIVNLMTPGVLPVNRGDIVVFVDPGGWLPQIPKEHKQPLVQFVDSALEFIGIKAEESVNHLIKRVIGTEGDRVECCDAFGRVTVNDTPLQEDYIDTAKTGIASGTPFSVVVPKGHVWVMGDNRYNSQDSRYHTDLPTHGFVPVKNITGKAILINWPLNRLRFL